MIVTDVIYRPDEVAIVLQTGRFKFTCLRVRKEHIHGICHYFGIACSE